MSIDMPIECLIAPNFAYGLPIEAGHNVVAGPIGFAVVECDGRVCACCTEGRRCDQHQSQGHVLHLMLPI
jgi:hypothetical protein